MKPEYSWKTWQELTGENAPKRLKAPYPRAHSSYPRPLRVVDDEQGLRMLEDPREWAKRRAQLRANAQALFGTGPIPPDDVPFTLGQTRTIDHHVIETELTFEPEPGEEVHGTVLRPMTSTRRPAILCLHQTTLDGKDEPIGKTGDPSLHYALHLARAGFVTFAFDIMCFGRRRTPSANHYGDSVTFYRKHPSWSIFGKIAYDCSRAIDVLSTLPWVDPERIGCIGHSLGGHSTLVASAFDQRIKAAVSNCGFIPWAAEIAIGRLNVYYDDTALLPRLKWYDGHHGRLLPIDYYELLALIAPRPFLTIAPPDDRNWQNGADEQMTTTHSMLLQSLEEVNRLYAWLGRTESFAVETPQCGHSFPDSSRRRAYGWLQQHLDGHSCPMQQ